MINKWVTILGTGILAIGLTACSDTRDKEDSSNEHSVKQETPTNEQREQTPNDSNENESTDSEQQTTEPEENKDQDFSNLDPTITVLANKQHGLEENYAPDDLVKVDVPTILENPEINQLRKVAADALKGMFDKAKESDIHLYARSGYRSYQTQFHLFNNYAAKHGEKAANRYSAKPGHSEHQTGLSMDVTSESVNFQLEESFGETKEGKWVSEHAHEFGFIIRYPKGMEEITGYIYEPWHIRYLGVDLATKVYESGLTYEEYLVEEGIIDEVNS